MKEARIKLGIDTSPAQRELDKFAKTSQVITKVKVEVDENTLQEQYRVIETFTDKAGKSFKQFSNFLTNDELHKYLEKDISAFEELGATIVGFTKCENLQTLVTNLEKGFRETSKSTETLTTKLGEIVTQTREVNKAGEGITTTIIKYKDDLGNLITTTEKYDETNKRLISTHTDSNKVISEQDTKIKETSKDIDTLIDKEGNMLKVIRELGADGKQYETTITQTKDALGNVTTVTEKWDTENKKLISSNREVTKTVNEQKKALEEEKNKLKETSKEVSTYIDEQGNLTKKIIETDSSGKNLRTEIKKTKDEFGNVTTTTEVYDNKLNKLVSRNKEVSNSTEDLTAKNKSMAQSFTDCVSKVTRFYLASLPIRLVTQAINEAKESLLEYDKALTEFKKVTNLSSNEISGYVSELGKIGQEVGRTVTEMIDSVTQMRKAGYNEEDAKYLAKITELYKNTADEELSSAEASSVLISQMKAFNIEAKDAIRITDSING